jgi:hypothetical protein
MKNQKDLLEGRTKEWDTNEWQGKTQSQIENSNKLLYYVFVAFVGGLAGYTLMSLILSFVN